MYEVLRKALGRGSAKVLKRFLEEAINRLLEEPLKRLLMGSWRMLLNGSWEKPRRRLLNGILDDVLKRRLPERLKRL